MSKPTVQQVHVDQPLTAISIAYTPGLYIAERLFPGIPVNKLSGLYFTYTKADWMRREATVRAPGARAHRADYGLSTAAYICVEKAIAKSVPDEVVDNADAPLRPLEDATKFVTEQILSELENDVADLAFGTGWSTSATPSPLWSNDTSTPLEDIETGMNSTVTTIGRDPNKAAIGRGAWRYLKNHPDVVDRIKYSAGPNSPAIVTVQAIAALVGVDELLVGTAVENTAAEGAAATQAFLWGTSMLLAYVASAPSLLTPSAGYTFNFAQREISRFREEQERSDIVEARQSWDAVITAADAGYLLKAVA